MIKDNFLLAKELRIFQTFNCASNSIRLMQKLILLLRYEKLKNDPAKKSPTIYAHLNL